MRIITDHKVIRRNNKISKIMMPASLLVLGLGIVIALNDNISLFWISLVCLAVGFLLSQIAIYFNNRWGKSPRFDEKINTALKGLEARYTLYHYSSPVPHLLLGPAGILILLPYAQQGVITYDENKQRWKQKGGNWYMKIFAQEGLGRPDLEIQSYLEDMLKFMAKELPEVDLPEPQIVMVFTDKKVSVQAENAPVSALTLDRLKEFVRKRGKENQIPLETLEPLFERLPQESID